MAIAMRRTARPDGGPRLTTLDPISHVSLSKLFRVSVAGGSCCGCAFSGANARTRRWWLGLTVSSSYQPSMTGPSYLSYSCTMCSEATQPASHAIGYQHVQTQMPTYHPSSSTSQAPPPPPPLGRGHDHHAHISIVIINRALLFVAQVARCPVMPDNSHAPLSSCRVK